MITQRLLIFLCLGLATTGAAIAAILDGGPDNPSGPALIKRVQTYYEAVRKKNFVAAQSFLAPGARSWFDKKAGDGDPWTAAGGTWAHWDSYFHGKLTFG